MSRSSPSRSARTRRPSRPPSNFTTPTRRRRSRISRSSRARNSTMGRPCTAPFPTRLVQMGDPLSKRKDRAKVGTGGPGYTLPPEIHRKHTRGAIAAGAAARQDQSRRGSRTAASSSSASRPMPSYDGQYTVFGNVLWGLETLNQISETAGRHQRQPRPTRRDQVDQNPAAREASAAAGPGQRPRRRRRNAGGKFSRKRHLRAPRSRTYKAPPSQNG